MRPRTCAQLLLLLFLPASGAARPARTDAGRHLAVLAQKELVDWFLEDAGLLDEDDARAKHRRELGGAEVESGAHCCGPEKKWLESGDEEIVYTVHRHRKRSLVRVTKRGTSGGADDSEYGDAPAERRQGADDHRAPRGPDLRGTESSNDFGHRDAYRSTFSDAGGTGSGRTPREQDNRQSVVDHDYYRYRRHDVNNPLLRSYEVFDFLIESLAKTLRSAEDNEADDYELAETSSVARKKLKKRGLKKYLLPLLMAYKLKFFALIPLMLGGLVLMVGSTGMAGFFFALFTAVMSLRSGHHSF